MDSSQEAGPNEALQRIAARWRFRMNPKGHDWAARAEGGRSATIQKEVTVNIEGLALWAFAGSFLLPALALVAGRAAGVSALRLAGVMIGFWFLSVASSILAIIGISQAATEAVLLRNLLITNGIVYAILIILKLLFFRAGQAAERPGDQTGQDVADSRATTCVPKLVNEGGGIVPFTRSGSTGGVGWIFFVANSYSWTISLNITATDSSATGTASATGRFSPWYSLTFTNRNASSSVTGNVKCERIQDDCVADASGGQDQDTDVDYTSAVIINGSESDSKASLDVEVAAAVAGQVAISSITVGGQVGGQNAQVTVGVTINLPTTANDSKKVSRSYAYRCSEVETL